MRVKSEEDLLDPGIRKKIIQEIGSREERARRDRAYQAQKCLKDQSKMFVIDKLLQTFQQTTVYRMEPYISNISFMKKIVDKLARVYNYGVTREIQDNEEQTENLENISSLLNINQTQKHTNRYLKAHKNLAMYIKPVRVNMPNGERKTTLKLQPLSPHLYSVVEQYEDRTRPLAYVLSNYEERVKDRVSIEPAKEGRTIVTPQTQMRGDDKDQIIADTPEDENAEKEQFIWWSDNYHFTTNEAGEILKEGQPTNALGRDEITNPIGELPFVNYAIEQDGSFWAQGGDDLVEGNLILNALISNLNHISIVQGYGQFYMIGKNLPKNLEIGPDKSINLEYEQDEDPKPEIGFLNASPPLADIRQEIEMYVALLLTTNNLSTSGISIQLQGSTNFASGIALAIDKSESQEDVKEQQQIFHDKEPEMFRKINKWISVFKSDPDSDLDERLSELELPDGFEENFILNFGHPDPIVSESERLDNMQKKKELGIASLIDLIKDEYPSLTDEQAEQKAREIQEEKLKNVLDSMGDLNRDANQANGTSSKQPASDDPNGEDDTVEEVAVEEIQDDQERQETATTKEVSLNGAQVSSLVSVIQEVANGRLPRDTGVSIISTAFGLKRQRVSELMGEVGRGFTIKDDDKDNNGG